MTTLLARPAPPAHRHLPVRPRWRGASHAVSWALVVLATVGGVHLGLAAPAVSPVAPHVATASVPAAPQAAVGPGRGDGGPGRGGRRG